MSKLRGRLRKFLWPSQKSWTLPKIFSIHTCDNQKTLFLLIILNYSRLNLKLQEHIFWPKQAWQMTFHFKLRWSALISRLINGHNQDAATTTHLHAYPLHTCILKTLHAYFVECVKHKNEWQNKWWSSVIYKWTSFRCSHGSVEQAFLNCINTKL